MLVLLLSKLQIKGTWLCFFFDPLNIGKASLYPLGVSCLPPLNGPPKRKLGSSLPSISFRSFIQSPLTFCPFLGWPFHDSYCVPKECNPGSFDFHSLLGSLMRWLGTSLILFPWSSLCPRGVYAWGKSVGIRHKVRSPSLLPINMVEGG